MQERGTEHRHRQKTSASMEQYVETIADLLKNGRVCKISGIASQANVSRPAASRAVRELAGRGLVEHQSYGGVILTPEGARLARRLSARHQVLYRFLVNVLRYPDDVAERDASHLKHHVDDEFVSRLAQLTVFLEADAAVAGQWQNRVEKHLKELA